MSKLRVLIACEFSEIVKEQFLLRGHDAHSCDLLPGEKGLPNHHQCDVLEILNDGWDLVIAHPPCTYLCRHRSRWHDDVSLQQEQAKKFFLKMLNCNAPKIVVENPIPLKSVNLPPYSQLIQPWQFGHDYSKRTALWLRGLPKLTPTKIVSITYYYTPKGRRFTRGWYMTPRNSIARSRTFTGIAKAMAEQWGSL